MPAPSISPEFPGHRGFWLPQNDGCPALLAASAAAAANSAAGGGGSAPHKRTPAVKGLDEDQKESCKRPSLPGLGLQWIRPARRASCQQTGGAAQDGTERGRGRGATALDGKNAQGWDALLSASLRNPPDTIWAARC